MSKDRPLRDYEVLETTNALGDDHLVGKSWVVQPPHFGHTMTVVGRIVGVDGNLHYESGMYLVRCSCGDEFRVSHQTIDRKKDS